MENETQQTSVRQIVKKITTKIVCGKIDLEKLFEYGKSHGATAIMPLYGILGIASDYTPGSTDLGPFVKLFGQFKAVNHETGQEFRSGAAILPGAASDLIYGALKGLGEGGGSIEFALRVGVVRDDTSPVHYTYVVEQAYKPQQQDALGDLESRLSLSSPKVAQIADKSEAATGTGSKKK